MREPIMSEKKKRIAAFIRRRLIESGTTDIILDLLIFALMLVMAYTESPFALAVACTMYITCAIDRASRNISKAHSEGYLLLKLVDDEKKPEEEKA